ncbi:MAG: hypothetical protein CFE26_06925 [Verrucomicrobiales bacterium VVV1]|nr:MAG: hypothetical protein CFE26_06925 [Verrucomicrobiales bacterium VVV1]
MNSSLHRRWLEEISWELVVWQNQRLCAAKNAHHGPTSDGHAETKALWESKLLELMGLDEVVELCRRCHRMAPFTNFNGNTFAAIARALIDGLGIADQSRAVARSLAGHIVAGVASDEEVEAFRKFCGSLD